VLLVEDSEDDAAAALRWLKRAGYTVTSERVDTAAEMSAKLDQGHWDIVLCDHDMPQFSSQAALQLVRDRGMDVPFVIVSGNISEAVVVNALKAGAQDFVSKNDLSRLGPAVERARREIAERLERRRAEEALRQSEERFALAVEATRDGLWDLNLTTGQVYYSRRFQEMLGFEAGELQGTDAFMAQLDAPERERVLAATAAHFEQRVPYDLELVIRTKQGENRWYYTRGQAVRDEATGKVTRFVGALSDLSARKRTESELREQLAIIRRQQEAIRVLSVPIIEVWDGVLTVPVLGVLDLERTAELMATLLAAVTRTHCRHVILDVTGVATMDAATAEHVIRVVRALQLLGAIGIVVGIQPSVAKAIVSLGVDLSSITTLANLREALMLCMKRGRG
jgi:PAS domain S-box-containing protein